jgi:anhydro-N-acetylmuramic acid kinase
MKPYFIGLMSGTSLDGTDGVLASFHADGGGPRIHAHAHRPFPAALRQELLALNQPGDNELHRAALCGNALSALYAEVVAALLRTAGLDREQVQAIGCHGQTVRHRPREFDGVGYTLQLNNPARLAELCGIDVVSDFRSRDIAAGGQGAPLVPAFHRAVFGRQGQSVAVMNIGGMSNVTVIDAQGQTSGFDCGPGNVLLDHWCLQHTGQAFDRDGQWAASGQPVAALLEQMLAEPFFQLPPPKSTGRDLFNAGWLQARLAARPPAPPQDVQATLAELTAASCVDAIARHTPPGRQVLVCGGGAFNGDLLARMSRRLGAPVSSTDQMGLPPEQVESAAFAWLAQARVLRQPANLVSATGAQGPRILGAIYPA